MVNEEMANNAASSNIGSSKTTPTEEFEEMLLQAARNGDSYLVDEILQAEREGRVQINVDCKGRNKSNHGWSPLHLASYFGHQSVAEILLKNNADVNIRNDSGDTPLHKASFTGREALVILLVQHNADINIINGEGQTPKDLALDREIRKLLDGAEKTEVRKKEENLLRAAREGDTETVTELSKSTPPLNINCVDACGNTALHCAAYRSQKEVAVLLLQLGIDTLICNKRGQRALDLAQSTQMKQLLDVQPIRELQKHVTHFEGLLMKRSRFLGWKSVYVVLERGVLTYFNSRADASCGVNRKGFKHLDGAKVSPLEEEDSILLIHFSDNTTHRLSVPLTEVGQLTVQKWVNAFQEHIAYSTHYINQGTGYVDSDDEDTPDILKLGSLRDVLQTAQAYQQLLERQIGAVENIVHVEEDEETKQGSVQSAIQRLHQVVATSRNMVTSLGHCLNIYMQQDEVRMLQLKQEQEKCRVLEQALRVLAKEHHELEQSISQHTPFQSPKSLCSASALRSPRYYDTSDDEFYDANEGDFCETLSSDLENDTSSQTLMTANSFPGSYDSGGSTATLTSQASHRQRPRRTARRKNVVQRYGRTELPVPMFSRNDFSVWSILKHCIGKELSKITMPVIFNEPLSFLQRITEYMEFSYLLTKASQCQDPVTRLEYVTAFAVSALASNWERLGKPFNPLLGETYELVRPDFQLISEQVSHHPPISAFHAESPHFKFHGSIHPKLKFWGKSVEIQPKGTITLDFPEHGESYTWTNVNCCVHNIIVGKLWIEQYGVMEVVNHKNGLRCVLNFKPAGWFSKDLHRLEGFIYDKQKKKLRYLYGKWTDLLKSVDIPSYDDYVKSNADLFKRQMTADKSPRTTPTSSPAHTPKKGGAGVGGGGGGSGNMYKFNSLSAVLPFGGGGTSGGATDNPDVNGIDGGGGGSIDGDEPPKNDSTFSLDIPNSTLLWECDPRPENSAQYYQFTHFAMSLNEMNDEMKAKLPTTDSRLRPDIRKLEAGDIDGAAVEKNRLEEKQRDARKSRKKDKDGWAPKWFRLGNNAHVKGEEWQYAGGYWDRKYDLSPDIF